jgi:FeS assembly SUF system protein
MSRKPTRVPLETTGPTPMLPASPVPSAPPAGAPPEAAAGEPLPPEKLEEIQDGVVKALCTCFDPEIPVNIYELGLIYGIDVLPTGGVVVRMTLTSPACPVAGSLPPEVEAKVRAVPGVTSAKVEVVWDPPWTPDRMTEAARLQLGIDY